MEFETYKGFSPFGRPHPSTLCLTSTLADARATPPSEDECRRLVHSRLQASSSLSSAQFDAVVLAAASHESGDGFLLCDGTGVGKGRELVAIATNWCLRHETRAVVYLSLANVATDAARDVRDCGDFTKDLVFYDCRDLTTEWPKTGIVFVPYTSLNETSLKRIQQLLHHGGSLVLDESHTITNISGKSASMRALLCQKLLKFAKDASAPISITFASATFATRLLDVEIYAEPLGLVGPRAPFPTFACLASKLGSCPVEHGTNSSLEPLLSLQTLAFLAHPRTFSPRTRMHGTARIGPFVERRLRSSNLLEQPLRHPRLDKTRTRILVERRLRSSNLPEQPLRHPRLDKAQTRILVAQWHFLRRRRSPTAASSTRDCVRSTSRPRS
jgi:hypothetical protein